MRTDGLQLEIGESDFLDACYFRMHRPEREGKKKQGKEKRWSPYELDSRSFNRESTLRFWVSVCTTGQHHGRSLSRWTYELDLKRVVRSLTLEVLHEQGRTKFNQKKTPRNVKQPYIFLFATNSTSERTRL